MRTDSESEILRRQMTEYTRGIPEYNLEVGNIRFVRAEKKDREGDEESEVDKFSAFGGIGQSLRQAKKK